MEIVPVADQSASSCVNLPESPCERCCGFRFCVFGRLNRGLRRSLEPQLRQQRLLHKGDKLFTPGSDFNGLYIVKSGSFKSAYYDTSGDQQVIGFYFPSDLLGGDGIPSGRHRYDLEALETATVCSLLYPRAGTLRDPMAIELLSQIMTEFARQSFRESSWLLVLGRLKADQRLARFLLTLSERMRQLGRSVWEFPLSMPRHDIANHLGIANETVSRLFKRFEGKGLILAKRRWVQLLDIDALHALADMDHGTVSWRQIA